MKDTILSGIQPQHRAKTLDRVFRTATRHLAEDYLTDVSKYLEDYKNKLREIARKAS